jgi:hypothetical protein
MPTGKPIGSAQAIAEDPHVVATKATAPNLPVFRKNSLRVLSFMSFAPYAEMPWLTASSLDIAEL